MRGFDMALAAFALHAAPARRVKPERRLVPAVDEPGVTTLYRTRIDQAHAALVASLWPEPYRQCVVRPLYLNLKAPAAFGIMHVVGRAAEPNAGSHGARALLQRLRAAFRVVDEPSSNGISRAA